jgi:hypothetical protein
MLEAINIGIDFLAVLISDKCSLVRPVVPDIKGSLCSIQKLMQDMNPVGEEKSITADT